MSDDKTLITLPEAEDMLMRLKNAHDEASRVERLYPILAKNGGQEKTPLDIIIMVQLAIIDYTMSLPLLMTKIVQEDMVRYIDAIVVDVQAAAKTKAVWAEIQNNPALG